MQILTVDEDISLGPLTLDDAEIIFSLVDESRGHLDPYLYWVECVVDIESARKYIAQRINSGLNGSSWWTIGFQGQIAGVFAIKSIDHNKVAECGYWLGQAFTKRGIISRVLQRIVCHLQQQRLANTLAIHCLEQNISSIKQAKKLGAVLVGRDEGFLEADGVVQDLLHFHVRV